MHRIDVHEHPVLDIHGNGVIEAYKHIYSNCKLLSCLNQTVPISCSCINPQNNQHITHEYKGGQTLSRQH